MNDYGDMNDWNWDDSVEVPKYSPEGFQRLLQAMKGELPFEIVRSSEYDVDISPAILGYINGGDE